MIRLPLLFTPLVSMLVLKTSEGFEYTWHIFPCDVWYDSDKERWFSLSCSFIKERWGKEERKRGEMLEEIHVQSQPLQRHKKQ